MSHSENLEERIPLKRRRKTSSCVSCRKLKTRCDFEPPTGKCHRCNVLKMPCSLTYEKKIETPERINDAEQVVGDSGDGRLDRIERQLGEVLMRLDSSAGNSPDKRLPDRRSKSSEYKYFENLGKKKWNYLDNSTFNAPLNVISRIDARLFGRVDRYISFAKLCEREFFETFYKDNRELCIRLASDFLKIAHFWIVPGGIKEITHEYVKEHPFITAVFVLLAMGFDENYSYVKEQEDLYWIVRKLLAMATTTSPLTDHDVEAILYCSLYNIARKPAQPLLDSWMVSSDGLKQTMLCTSFQKIIKRRNAKQYKEKDLFHLRIWTLLCVCHLQYSIGNGRPQLIPDDFLEVCDAVIDYPLSNLEDNINYALVKLCKQVHDMFYDKDLIINLIKYEQVEDIEEVRCFKIDELHRWMEHWKELIDNDGAGTLLFNFDFYHVILSRRFISSFKEVSDFKILKYMEIGYNTAMYHSRRILNRFLELPKTMVKGCPSFLLTQIVYACLTLYDFQGKFENKFNMKSLNLVSRVYWHLNHVGETKNDATDTVGQIIKTLVDVRSVTSDSFEVGESVSLLNENEFEMDYRPLHDEISHDFTSQRNENDNQDLGDLLNVERFATFEDFFKGIIGQ